MNVMDQYRPLSSYNTFYELQQEICEVLNQSPVLSAANLKFFPEQATDIEYEIQKSIKSQGLAAIVMCPNGRYLGHNGNVQAYQLDDLTLQIVEYTPVNRAKNQKTVITGLDLANYAAETLAGPNAIIGFGNICTKSIEQGEDNGLLVTKAVFQTTMTNDGVRPIIYIPYVTQDEMSAYVGDGKVDFIKSGEIVGSFSANQHTNISIDLDASAYATRWGQITGELSDQVDLQEALDNKLVIIKDWIGE